MKFGRAPTTQTTFTCCSRRQRDAGWSSRLEGVDETLAEHLAIEALDRHRSTCGAETRALTARVGQPAERQREMLGIAWPYDDTRAGGRQDLGGFALGHQHDGEPRRHRLVELRRH